MPEQLHLEERVVDGHRLPVVLLLAHDVPRLVVEVLGGQLGNRVEHRLGGRRDKGMLPGGRGQGGCGGRDGDGSPPPVGRVQFLSMVGLTVNFLALAIIVLDGVGAPLLNACQQS